jgi:hypothetical protein
MQRGRVHAASAAAAEDRAQSDSTMLCLALLSASLSV